MIFYFGVVIKTCQYIIIIFIFNQRRRKSCFVFARSLSKDFVFLVSNLMYFSHEARATKYLFKLPRVHVTVLSISAAASCSYTKQSSHTTLRTRRLFTRGHLNKYSLHVPHGRNRPGTRKTKSFLNERKWRLKISHDSALFSNTCNNFLLSLSA